MDGLQWVSMETKASRRETGCLMVLQHNDFLIDRVHDSLVIRLVPYHFYFLPTEFKFGKAPILIATDVASRGLGMYIFVLLHSPECYICL